MTNASVEIEIILSFDRDARGNGGSNPTVLLWENNLLQVSFLIFIQLFLIQVFYKFLVLIDAKKVNSEV